VIPDIHLDVETRSDVGLKEVGLFNYVTHPSTRVLLAAWAVGDGEVQQADYEDGFERLHEAVFSGGRICAWNAPFEWAVMTFVLGWKVPLEWMYCVMAHALYRAFPAKLDRAAKAMLDRGKLEDAERLLRVWCFPTPPSGRRPKAKPGDWDRFCLYNRIDVELERDIAHFLRDCGLPWPEAEQRVWLQSERINWRGVKIDVDACRAAVAMHDRLTEKALAEIRSITGVANPNSGKQLCDWLDVPSLAKDVMPALLDGATGDRRRVLELRQQIALSAPKKYTVALAHQNGGRVRNMLQYSGAGRTHRWSGRGIQPQNLRRGLKSDEEIAKLWSVILAGDDAALARLGDPFVILANLVRTIIVPANGRRLNVADYSSIEVVMVHWGAGDEPMLVKLREGLDPYKVFAASHWRIPMADVSKEQRTFSKPVVLGCAYGLGANTLVDYAEGMGVAMTLEEATAAVATYREKNRFIVRFWYGLEEAMRKAIAKPGATFRFRHFAFRFVDNGDGRHHCLMRLPSGTSITYWNAGIDPETDKLFYWGVDQYTGNWSRIKTWGGKLVENSVQSISRAVLVHGMDNALTLQLDVVLHVHDEIVNDETREDDERTLLDCMKSPPWCPDAPIHAAAFSCPRYRKD
jgi:DNA polymerase